MDELKCPVCDSGDVYTLYRRQDYSKELACASCGHSWTEKEEE